MLHYNQSNPESKCNWVMDSIDKGWSGDQHHFWGFIGTNEVNILKCKRNKTIWYYWDMPYYGRWYKDTQEEFYWRVSENHIHYRKTINYPSNRFRRWKVTPKDYGKGTKILVCPSSETMTRYTTGLSVNGWLKQTIDKLKAHTDRPIEIRHKPRANGTSGPSVATIPFEVQAQDTYCVVTSVSLCAVEAQLLGIPTICHKDSFARDISSTKLEEIESPKRVDTKQWFYNLAYSQFTHKEIESGLPEEIFNAQIICL